MVKAGADRHADAAMVPVEVDDVIEVVEAIDEHEAHTCADESGGPSTQVRIRIVRCRIP